MAVAGGNPVTIEVHPRETFISDRVVVGRSCLEAPPGLPVVHADTETLVVHQAKLTQTPATTCFRADLERRQSPRVVDCNAVAPPAVDGSDGQCGSRVALSEVCHRASWLTRVRLIRVV